METNMERDRQKHHASTVYSKMGTVPNLAKCKCSLYCQEVTEERKNNGESLHIHGLLRSFAQYPPLRMQQKTRLVSIHINSFCRSNMFLFANYYMIRVVGVSVHQSRLYQCFGCDCSVVQQQIRCMFWLGFQNGRKNIPNHVA